VNLDNVTRDDWIVGGLALLLAIDLLFFPWFGASITVGPLSVSASSSGTGSPDGWLGVLAVLAALAVLADLAIERLSPQTAVPEVGGSREMTRFVLAVATACFMALKFLFHPDHFSGIVTYDWGFYLGALVVAGLVYLATLARNARALGPTVTSRPGAPAGPAGSAGAGGPPGSGSTQGTGPAGPPA